jgi:hypothetical protein
MNLVKNSINMNVDLTLAEKTTIDPVFYLFEFQNDYTKVKSYAIFTDVSIPGVQRERTNLFNIEVVDTVVAPNQVKLGNVGLYNYIVYEQSSDSNLDPALATGIVERGRLRLIGSEDSVYVAHTPEITYVAHEQ